MNVHLGSMHAASYEVDPKHVGFVFRRYHFVARMLAGAHRVLEVGCGDGTGARVVRAAVNHWMGIDKQDQLLSSAVFMKHDIVERPFTVPLPFTAAYALDVLEHIDPADEDKFFQNINATLEPHGTVIIGSPSLESQVHASELSKLHHVNCKTEDGLRQTLQQHYHNVYLLGLNDYNLHDGFGPLVHYRLAIAAGRK